MRIELYLCASMIRSQPKTNSLFAISLFLFGIFAITIWVTVALINNPSSYFILKLILVPTLLVIGIVVAVRSYFSALKITLGENKISYKYLLSSEKTHKISSIKHWEEHVVKQKSSTYRRVSIELSNGKKLLLSNQENTHYDKVLSYLKKKVKQ